MNEIIVPPFSTHVARSVVKKINSHVNSMIGNSNVVDGKWDQRDYVFGLFQKDELQLGELLGTGGFSDVYEVTNFKPKSSTSIFGPRQLAVRRLYAGNATKNGKGKYVVKHLRTKMMQDTCKFCMAAADLVVEAQYLSSLDHQNILKIHGWSAGGVSSYSEGKHDGYFLLLDRLHETLYDRLKAWKREKSNESLESSLKSLSLCSNSSSKFLDRTKIAHEIAEAIKYLHKMNIVFRDLKPSNIGFDEHGTVKIFDFGLAREMPKDSVNVNDVFQMSGRIGTVRYMAPEIALGREYNQKVDTYSWAVIFCQCLTLEKPYGGISQLKHDEVVSNLGRRPALSEDIPRSIQRLLRRSWAQSMYTRLSMAEVCTYLERIKKELDPAGVTRSASMESMSSLRRNASSSLISMAA